MKLSSSFAFASLVVLTACAGQPRRWGTPTASNATASSSSNASSRTIVTAPAARAPRSTATTETTSASIDTACDGAHCIAVCDATGDARACKEAGYALRDGSGIEANFPHAATSFDRACQKRDREGCHELGKAYAVGEGVNADPAKAALLYSTSCDLGLGEACEDLSKVVDKGQGVPKDHVKAMELLAKGCVAEDFKVWTCTALRRAADAKDATASRAIATWKKGCAKKDVTSCRGLERITKR